MAVPWQTDTAFCRSGFSPEYDPYLPTFWPARVPNQVLTEDDYSEVMRMDASPEERLVAFNRRKDWLRYLSQNRPYPVDQMMTMIEIFGAMGVLEPRPGPRNHPDIPEVLFVETFSALKLKQLGLQVAELAAAEKIPLTELQRAGWQNYEQMKEFQAIRFRRRFPR